MPSLKFSMNSALNGDTMLRGWRAAEKIPGGKRAFSKVIGRMAPYTSTIGAELEDLGPGYARMRMTDRRAVRNHLRSIHAIALANFGEETSGVAMMSRLPVGMRGIVTEINIEYLKKARGTLLAESTAPDVVAGERAEYHAHADIRDAAGETVARFRATWLIGPAR